MTTQQDEHFSALLDDELDSANREIMLNQLMSDKQTKQRWYRYHLISDAMQAKLPDKIDPQFSASVMAALADEPAILAPKQTSTHSTHHSTPSIKHRAAGFAIAATVAVVAVLGVQNLNEPSKPDQVAKMPSNSEFEHIASQSPQLAQTPMATQIAPQALTPAQVAQVRQPQVLPQTVTGGPAMTVSSTQSALIPADSENPQFDPRLHQYIVNHNQNISGGQLQSIMPYVRIVVSPTVVNQQGQQ